MPPRRVKTEKQRYSVADPSTREPLRLALGTPIGEDEARLWDYLAMVILHGWLSRGILGESEPIAQEVATLADDMIRERRQRRRKEP